MAVQFVNYFLDDFDTEEANNEHEDLLWNSTELQRNQNLNHSRVPNINHQTSFQPTFLHWRPNK